MDTCISKLDICSLNRPTAVAVTLHQVQYTLSCSSYKKTQEDEERLPVRETKNSSVGIDITVPYNNEVNKKKSRSLGQRPANPLTNSRKTSAGSLFTFMFFRPTQAFILLLLAEGLLLFRNFVFLRRRIFPPRVIRGTTTAALFPNSTWSHRKE